MITDQPTGRAHPDDVARLKLDLAEFYDAGLAALADAALRWIATGEGFDALRAQTAKAGAIAVTPDGKYGATNKLDQVLRVWQDRTHARPTRPHRLAFFQEPARCEPKCMWRLGVLLAGNAWVTGQSAFGAYDPAHPETLAHNQMHNIVTTIRSFHWAKAAQYSSLDFLDALLCGEHPGPYPALRLYLARKDPNTTYSIVHSDAAADYLAQHAADICAVFPYSDILANAIAELKIADRGYTAWLVRGIEGAARKSARMVYNDGWYSKTRASIAIRALATIPADQLAQELGPHFAAADDAPALALLDLLSLRGGPPARALMRERLKTETKAPIREALERILRVEIDDITDDANSYAALDGARIAIPPTPPIEPEFPPPDSVRADIERYRLQINQGITAQNEQRKRWYDDAKARGQAGSTPSREDPLLEAESVDALLTIAREQPPPPRPPHPLHKAIYALKRGPSYSWESRNKPWSARPLHLLQLVRLADTDRLDTFTRVYSNIAASEVERRLSVTLDMRTLHDAIAATGREPKPLSPGGYEDFAAANVWPYFAERMELIEQGFANGAEQAAMATLSRFPKIPKRFAPALINLALSEKRAQFAPAQALLGAEPSLTPLILPQLDSKAAERRRVAAQWLGKRGDAAAIAPLRAAAQKEKSAPVYAAILNALKALGADLSDYFDEAKLMAAAEESLAKADPDKKGWFPIEARPDLFWADGRPLHPTLIRHWIRIADDLKLAAGNAQIDLYLDQLQPASAEAFGLFVLKAWIARDTTPISEAEVQRIGAEIYSMFQATPQAHTRYIDNTPISRQHLEEMTPAACLALARQQFAGRIVASAYDNRGLLAIAERAPAAEAVRLVRPYLKDHYKRMGQCKALLEALAANGAPSALQLIFATATKSKNKGVQKHASALVDTLAEARGWTRDELADRTAPTAGLDDAGALELPIGEKTYLARLDSALNLILYNPDGGKISALPAPKDEALAADAKEAKAALANAKKELKQTVEMQAARFYEALCAERVWSVADFRAFIAQHPILSRLAERLIWLALDADGAPLRAFRPLGDGTLTDAHDQPVTLDGAASIKLAHLATLGADQAEAWLKHFADYELTPLFPQLTRPRRALPTELAEADSLEDRQGWVTDTFKLRSAATKLGWKRGPILDSGSFDAYEKALPGLRLKAVLSFSGSMVPEQNVRAAIHNIRFERAQTNGSSTPLTLADVPPVLLSEIWNDYHDIAAIGAFDADWEQVCPW